MLFNSLDYFFFILLVYLVVRSGLLSKGKQHLWLLLCSLFFYAYWNPIHVFILIYSGITDYYLGKKIGSNDSQKQKKVFLTLSIINNLGLLFIFKYLYAISNRFNDFFDWINWPFHLPIPEIILPIGISFFTFQTMSYSIDVFRGSVKPVQSRVEFMLYVSFFPQLVAGPILRASKFIPQLDKKFIYSHTLFFSGLFFVLLGLFKKICIADPIGILIVDPIYATENSLSAIDVILANYAYLFQIFYDFSGYSDIAIGSALILGYKIPHNFDSPFLCINPAQFWDRWHISLSHWVRDYIYYPMCVSKGKFKGRLLSNLFITILIIGIWHGANITFVCFGLFHACLAVLHRYSSPYLKKIKLLNSSIGKFICWCFFFNYLMIASILFRSEDVTEIGFYLHKLISAWNLNTNLPVYEFSVLMSIAFLVHAIRAHTLDKTAEWFSNTTIWIKILYTWAFILPITYVSFIIQGKQAFIYFQF
jgi:alginate O-acetyltransferase complex protein AlgI